MSGAERRDNLVLIGMPGVGKSTMGVVCAKMTNRGFLDCDLVIQQRYGDTLENLIGSRGAETFIGLEGDVLENLDCFCSVVATGGSAVYSQRGMEHLAEIGTIIYLRGSLAEIEKRLGGLEERGVVVPDGVACDLASIYESRAPLYEKYAQYSFDTDGLSIDRAVVDFVAFLRAEGLA